MVNESYVPADYQELESNDAAPLFLRRDSASNRTRKAKKAEAKNSYSEVSFYNEYNDASFGIHEDSDRESSDNIDEISDLIFRTAEKQNADGTFGHEKEVSRKTSYYIIGMLLFNDKWKPYRIQIMKAGKALLSMGTRNEHIKDLDMQIDTLLKAAAISLIKKMKLYESNKKEIQEYLDEITEKLHDEEMNIFKEFKTENLQPMIDYIRYRVLSNFEYKSLKNVNRKEFARLLLSEVL